MDLQVSPEFESHFRLLAKNLLLHSAWFIARIPSVQSRFSDLCVRVALQQPAQFCP